MDFGSGPLRQGRLSGRACPGRQGKGRHRRRMPIRGNIVSSTLMQQIFSYWMQKDQIVYIIAASYLESGRQGHKDRSGRSTRLQDHRTPRYLFAGMN